MNKNSNEVLKAFAIDPIKAKKVFQEKRRNWCMSDYKEFWDNAMFSYPDDELKETANKLIDFLCENDIINYSIIGWEFLNYIVSYDGDCNADMSAFATDYIVENYGELLGEDDGEEAEEIRKAVEEAEKVWYWHHLLRYVIDSESIVKRVAQDTQLYVPYYH